MASFPNELDQRTLNPEVSVFASANAGAGKTALLARRVLALLLSGVTPSRILCLTFTKAAAAEMSSRVLGELGKWVMADDSALRRTLAGLLGRDPDDAAMLRARSLFATVLEAPDGIRIETIHGFCQTLLKRFPLEAGVSPHFSVMDSRSEQEMLGEARLRLLGTAREGDPLLQEARRSLVQMLGESSLMELLAEIVGKKQAFLSLFSQPGGLPAALDEVDRLLDIKPDTTLQGLIEEYCNYDKESLAALARIADLLLKSEAKTDQKTGRGIAAWLGEPEKRAAMAEEYADIFITGKNTKRVVLFTKNMLPGADLIDTLLEEQERIACLHEARQSWEIARVSKHTLRIAHELLSLYQAGKRAHAHLDYDDLILTACTLLEKSGMAAWVLYKLDGGIDHVLVDEAQDTSPGQWRIVQALTQEFFSGLGRSEAPRSLFVVGDEKQSIYSFQGADVAAFGAMRAYFAKRIAEAGKTVLSVDLTASFRSTREVLQAVDAVFARPQARAGLMFGDGELKHVPTRLGHAGLVELWPLIEKEEDSGISPKTKLARVIADTIRDWVENGTNPGDIMILLKKRSGLADALVRALKRRGVPVAGLDRMRLSDNLAVQDLIALGQVLLLPEDDLTLASLLGSPMFDIGEEELFTLAWNRGDKKLWQRLGESANEKCGRAYELLAELRARADFVAPYELYAHALDTLGARRRFLGRMGGEYADPIDEFLSQALLYEQGHVPSLQGFLHWLASSDSEIKRDMEQAGGAVRVMTVHGAKGLQAPIVILPDTIDLPRPDDRLLWHEADLPLLARGGEHDNGLSAGLREARKQAALAEYRRLLYVALTRAADRLYVMGASGKDKLSEESWYHLVKEGLSPIASPCGTKLGEGLRVGQQCHPERSEESPAAGDPSAPPQDNIFSFLTAPLPAEPVPTRPLTPSRPAEGDSATASPLAKAHLYQRGIVIHRLLQYLPDVPPAQREQAGERLMAGASGTMTEGELRQCLDEALAVINDPRCAFLFAPGSLAEAPIAGNIEMGGEMVTVSGQIDRLHVGEREVWIADFKSGRLPPADIPADYLRQMALYRRLLETMYPAKTVRCALVWTAAASVTILDKAQLDEAA